MPIPSAHDVELYTLSRGILYIATLDPTTKIPGSFTDLGEVATMDIEPTEEILDHFSRRSKVRVKDKVVTLESGYVLNFTLEEYSLANMALFVRGNYSGLTVSANQNLAGEYALRFVEDNAEGYNKTWDFRRVKIRPNGAMTLLGDEWSQMPFTAEGLDDSTNNPTSPFFDIAFHTTTTTSTTTSTTSSTTSTTTA